MAPGQRRRQGIYTNGGDGRDDFTELELVEDSGLSGGIETNHQNSHLLLTPEPVEQLRECETHLGDFEQRDARGLREVDG